MTNGDVYQYPFVPLKGTPPPVGVDKVELRTQDFKVIDTLQLGIVPNRKLQGEICSEPTPLFTCGGIQMFGEKAYHNSKDEGGTISATIDRYGLKVVFNPSKVQGKFSGELASVNDVMNVTAGVEKYLRNNGINVPLNDSQIVRVDLAKDRLMSQPCFAYQDVWGVLRGQRMKEKVIYPHGMRVGSKRKQGIFYDKGFEINPSKGESNLMRGEIRLLRGDTVAKQMSINTLNDLYQLDEMYLGSYYTNFINNDIFRLNKNSNQLAFDFTNEVQLLRSLKEEGRNSFKNYLAMNGVEHLLQKTGGIANLKRILSEVYTSRDKVNRMISEVETLLRRKTFIDKSNSTLASKYEEVRLQFVA